MSSKKSDLHLYADENFPLRSVNDLKSQGISITHAHDQRMLGKSDLAHLKLSKKLRRTLITLDRDFLYYRKSPTSSRYGIIVIAHTTAIPKNITEICIKILKRLNKELVKGSIITATRDKITKEKDGEIVFEKNI